MKALFSFLFAVSIMILAIFATQAIISDLSEVAEALTPWLFAMAVVSASGLWIALEEEPAKKPPAEEEPEEFKI
tara:strand:+ start:277 stop:498 length:222 start_codon:yes stop_codon:yes gene_type:complete